MGTIKTESSCRHELRRLYLLSSSFLRSLSYACYFFCMWNLVIYLLHLLFALHFPIFLIIIIKSMYIGYLLSVNATDDFTV